MILESTLAIVDCTVTVDIDELKVTGEEWSRVVVSIGDPTVCRCMLESLYVRLEVTVCSKPPHFTDFLACVKLIDVTVSLREVRNP